MSVRKSMLTPNKDYDTALPDGLYAMIYWHIEEYIGPRDLEYQHVRRIQLSRQGETVTIPENALDELIAFLQECKNATEGSK